MTASEFSAGEQGWVDRLGKLRDHVRQSLVTRQLLDHLPPPPATVIDVGCSQGTQALQLARAGYAVTAVDPSNRLLDVLRRSLAAESSAVAARIEVVQTDIAHLAESTNSRTFDVVMCHGVLMYFEEAGTALDLLARTVANNGMMSLLVRNADSLAMRPGLSGDWRGAIEAFDTASYINRLGLTARADRLDELQTLLKQQGLDVLAWYGVRVFSDTAQSNTPLPHGEDLAALIEAESRAGSMDPYRAVAPLIHILACR